jgi:hypothetical protein
MRYRAFYLYLHRNPGYAKDKDTQDVGLFIQRSKTSLKQLLENKDLGMSAKVGRSSENRSVPEWYSSFIQFQPLHCEDRGGCQRKWPISRMGEEKAMATSVGAKKDPNFVIDAADMITRYGDSIVSSKM